MCKVCRWSHTGEWLLNVWWQARLGPIRLLVLVMVSINRLGQVGCVTSSLGVVTSSPALCVIGRYGHQGGDLLPNNRWCLSHLTDQWPVRWWWHRAWWGHRLGWGSTMVHQGWQLSWRWRHQQTSSVLPLRGRGNHGGHWHQSWGG